MGEPFVSPFEHDEKLPQTFDPRTGTLKQDLTVSEYKALVISHIDKISKKGEEYSNVKEVSVQRCVDDYKKMLKQKRTYESSLMVSFWLFMLMMDILSRVELLNDWAQRKPKRSKVVMIGIMSMPWSIINTGSIMGIMPSGVEPLTDQAPLYYRES